MVRFVARHSLHLRVRTIWTGLHVAAMALKALFGGPVGPAIMIWLSLAEAIGASTAFAQPQTCVQQLAELMQETGVSGIRQVASQMHGRIQRGRIWISCPDRSHRPTISLSYPSEYPPESFYQALAVVTARATGHSREQMELRAHRCHRAAKRTKSGHMQKTFNTVRIACDRSPTHSTFTIRF